MFAIMQVKINSIIKRIFYFRIYLILNELIVINIDTFYAIYLS